MKVLIVTLDKNIFEPGSASLERLKEYAEFCQKLSVIVLTQKKFEPIISGNLAIIATGSSCRIQYAFGALKVAKKIMKDEKYDVVSTQDCFDTGHIGWLIKRKYKIPWQCQMHGDIFSPYYKRESIANEIRVWAAKFLLPKADGIRVVSERIKRSLAASGMRLKREPDVLPIYVDAPKFISSPILTDLKTKYKQFNFIILAASRLSREKNLDLPIKSMPEILKDHPQTGLVIVGEGKDERRLKKLAKNLKLESKVVFEPWANELASYYKTADLFLLTSNYEGWGMSVVEAAACACPIIMTDVGCAGEFIKNGENGLVISVGDKKGLVRAVEKIISDGDLASNLGKKAKESALLLPPREQYLDSYKRSLQDLLN